MLVGRNASNCSWGAMLPCTSHADQPPGVAVVLAADVIETGTPVIPARSRVASWPQLSAGWTTPRRFAGLARAAAAWAAVLCWAAAAPPIRPVAVLR